MPELPEVETTCRALEAFLLNKTIQTVVVRQAQLRLPVPAELSSKCPGQSIQSIQRRGKYIIIQLSEGYLLIHLGMSGHIRLLIKPEIAKKHDHIELQFNDQTILRYNDPRRFGLWLYSEQSPLNHPLLARIGVEPLSREFTADYLYERANKKKQGIKTFIMDSQIVVGVGNIYATESLFQAKINPLTPVSSITLLHFAKLIKIIQSVLKKAIHAGGTTLRDFSSGDGKPGYFAQQLLAYGRQGKPCTRCSHSLTSIKITGRSSTFCPLCQPLNPLKAPHESQ